jgi:DNA repair protein RecO (recombination protein O)
LLRLSRYLGFGASRANESVGGRMTDVETETNLDQLLKSGFENTPRFTRTDRNTLLDLLLKFYSDHIDTFGDMKSVPVLREIS